MVGIICPPVVEIGLTYLSKYKGHQIPPTPPAPTGLGRRYEPPYFLHLFPVPISGWYYKVEFYLNNMEVLSPLMTEKPTLMTTKIEKCSIEEVSNKNETKGLSVKNVETHSDGIENTTRWKW